MKPRKSAKPTARTRRRLSWTRLSDDHLLDVRICDLEVRIEGTPLEERIDQLDRELERRGLRFRPHFWLSTEWFSPDTIPGVAIPFYLAHPRLVKLENKQMLEVEGGTRKWCMQLLRHETGHAIDNAYRLRRRRKWQKIFGLSSEPYPDYYQPRPFSRRFVIHLDYWYAQSHPTEDFAETFAVWLGQDRSMWRKRFKQWSALRKLEYVDELMAEIADQPQPVRSRAKVEPLEQVRTTLRRYYQEKRQRYGVEYPQFYDRDLRRLFSETPDGKPQSAARFLGRIRPDIRRLVAAWTGEYQYTIDQVLQDMIARCRELELHVTRSPDQVKLDVAVLVAVQTMNYLHGGHHRIAL